MPIGFVCILLVSCKEKAIGGRGNLIVNFYMHANTSIDSSLRWYLFAGDVGTKAGALYTKGRGGYKEWFENSKSFVEFENLNTGNYIFRYYQDNVIKDHTVQVTAGKTNTYDLR